jgi:hypothetical protein
MNPADVLVPPEVRAQYVAIIDGFLIDADLTTVTVKQVRNAIQSKVQFEITPHKVRPSHHCLVRVLTMHRLPSPTSCVNASTSLRPNAVVPSNLFRQSRPKSPPIPTACISPASSPTPRPPQKHLQPNANPQATYPKSSMMFDLRRSGRLAQRTMQPWQPGCKQRKTAGRDPHVEELPARQLQRRRRRHPRRRPVRE